MKRMTLYLKSTLTVFITSIEKGAIMNLTLSSTYQEISDQPEIFISLRNNLDAMQRIIRRVFTQWAPEHVIFTGCGTSYYLAQTCAALFSHYNAIKAHAVPCSELFFHPELYVDSRKTLVCPITRSSATTEVRLAIQKVREFDNIHTLAVTCCAGSEEYNDALLCLPLKEDSVVMTKTFTAMTAMGAIISMTAAGKEETLRKMLDRLPSLAKQLIFEFSPLAGRILNERPGLRLFLTLGQGPYYGIAMECMNKIKEMSLSPAEAYHTLEYRHGPMSLTDINTLAVILASQNTGRYEKALADQLKGFGATILVVGEQTKTDWSIADYCLMPQTGLNDYQLCPAMGIVGQLLGLSLASVKGLDADHPRHLEQAIIL